MAALTWTADTDGNGGAKQSVSAVDAVAGTFTGTDNSTEGMSLANVEAFEVYVEAASGQTITASGTLAAYRQNPVTGRWARAKSYDIAATTLTGARGDMVAKFSVAVPAGRIGYAASSFTVSSGTLTIRLVPTSRRGELL